MQAGGPCSAPAALRVLYRGCGRGRTIRAAVMRLVQRERSAACSGVEWIERPECRHVLLMCWQAGQPGMSRQACCAGPLACDVRGVCGGGSSTAVLCMLCQVARERADCQLSGRVSNADAPSYTGRGFLPIASDDRWLPDALLALDVLMGQMCACKCTACCFACTLLIVCAVAVALLRCTIACLVS